eukprot:scaffold62_cov256-Pinguiococcus_pyrenoidosus.AAC.29
MCVGPRGRSLLARGGPPIHHMNATSILCHENLQMRFAGTVFLPSALLPLGRGSLLTFSGQLQSTYRLKHALLLPECVLTHPQESCLVGEHRAALVRVC